MRSSCGIFRSRPKRNVVYMFVVLAAFYGFIYKIFLQSGVRPFFSRPSITDSYSNPSSSAKAEKVKGAFVYAYRGYAQYAAPSDELKSSTKGKINNFNGWGVTAFDSLDTMLIMGLRDEYEHGLEVVRLADFTESEPSFIPYFETIIRYLGGLLSAYSYTTDAFLLDRAEELVERLEPAFDTPSGFPYYAVNPKSGKYQGPDIGILAEIASLQLEYVYLAKLTGKQSYFIRSQKIMNTTATSDLKDRAGMLPVKWNITSGEPLDYRLSVGGQADSAHEYLLKLYLLTGKTDKTALEMYIRTTTYIITNLLYLSPTRNLLYVTDTNTPTYKTHEPPSHVFEHLSCFLPGLFALGAHTLPLENLNEVGINLDKLGNENSFGRAGKGYKLLKGYNLKELHLWAAEGIAQTCWLTYADQPSGLGPDEIMMQTVMEKSSTAQDGSWPKNDSENYLWMSVLEKWKKSGRRGNVPGLEEKKPIVYSESERVSGEGKGRDYVVRKPVYLLRPETVESLYLLWKITGDEKWRSRGWKIFEAIERETKTAYGYTSLLSVDKSPAPQSDSMPSYFLAETLKYLYLMFVEEDPIDLKKWVFNTEGHPFPVFQFTTEEKARFNVDSERNTSVNI